MSDIKAEPLLETLVAIAEKNKTYAWPKEKTLHLARACLNIHAGCDYKIDPEYQYLVDEQIEGKDD